MDCVDLARSVQYLAKRGHCGISGERVVSYELSTRINALMMTAVTYDAAGDSAFYVGLPAKSGVGGGIVAVVPHVMRLCTWYPGLDDKDIGRATCRERVGRTGWLSEGRGSLTN